MLTANNKIFESQSAANGQWRDINNWTALSIHLKGLEGNVWVEVSNDPACLKDNTMKGVPVTKNLASNTNVNPDDATDQADTAFSADGQAMWSPSCLVWAYVRICKDSTAQTKTTTAFLFGQQG